MKPVKALVIAGTHSGVGKTTVTLGIMAALKRRGMRVAPFKIGPDFIDTSHHTRVTGRVCRNLDGWMLSRAYNEVSFNRRMQTADIAVVEGVMGLFDGYDGRSEAGSTAQMAKWLDLPVVLVVDARSMARSAAALIQGFERFDGNLAFAGVIFNRVGSSRHLALLKEAIEGEVGMPCFGGIRREPDIAIPERHLGLFTPEDHCLEGKAADLLAELIQKSIDMDALLERLPERFIAFEEISDPEKKADSPVRIGIARDRAFCFYYEDNLELLEKAGATLVFFSPIADSRLPDDLDGLYIGGGYPELHAGMLSENNGLITDIHRYSNAGMPIYGECGGFMYLCRELMDQNGGARPLVGCFPFSIRMSGRLKALGYREITLLTDTLLGPAGISLRGHEFHYSQIVDDSRKTDGVVYRVSDRSGSVRSTEGYFHRQTLGSYFHLHFGSCPEVATHLVAACSAYQRERRKKSEPGAGNRLKAPFLTP
ncbi:MAG: cobyrinate a,c-diamide synthase [Pseudomonadota bacterium]